MLAPLNRRSENVDQISSSLTTSASIAISDASKNVAENVPRLILLAKQGFWAETSPAQKQGLN
jgi:hypothetical protein